MVGRNIEITTTVQKSKASAQYDQNRRELFSLFASELKSTNKLFLEEVVGETKISSYQEKLQADSAAKVRKEWENVSSNLMEKLTKEAAQPFMKKRKLFLENVERNTHLQERADIRLPSIDSDCNFCGACSLLCPTDALEQETDDNGQKTITLHPYKCVDCRLCEEICYPEYIKLSSAKNIQLFNEETILAAEKI